MGKDRGFKKIHLPIVDGDQDLEHHPKNSLAYMVQVYLHPKWADKASAAKEVASNQIYSTFSV